MPSLRDRARGALRDLVLTEDEQTTLIARPAEQPVSPDQDSTGLGFGAGAYGNGWFQNQVTGAGTCHDPATANSYAPARPLPVAEIYRLGRNPLAARAIGLKWFEATREGWQTKIAPEESLGQTAQDAEDTARELADYANRLDLRGNVFRAGFKGEQYGEAIIVVGADDGEEDLSKPLKLDRIRTIRWLKVFAYNAPLTAQFTYGPMSSPLSENFGYPECYRVTDLFAPEREGYAEAAQRTFGTKQVNVHWTRCLRFPTPDATSTLAKLAPALYSFFSGFASGDRALSSWSQTVLTVKGLYEKMRRNRAQTEGRFRAIARFGSMFNAIILDQDNEGHRYDTRSLSGFPDQVALNMQRLSAESGIPNQILYGTDPKGFSSGEPVMKQWLNEVRALQTTRIQPELLRFAEMMMAAQDGSSIKFAPEQVRIEFNPLMTPTPKELADVFTATAGYLKTVNEITPLTRAEVLSPWMGEAFNPQFTPEQPTEESNPENQPEDPEIDPAAEEIASEEPEDMNSDDPANDEPQTQERPPDAGHTLLTASQLAEEFGIRPSKIQTLGKLGRLGMRRGFGARGAAQYSREDLEKIVRGSFNPAASEEDSAPTFDPFPNWHAARQRDPNDFERGSIRSQTLANGAQIRTGELPDGKREVQSVRLPKAKFSPSEARAWLTKHNYKIGAFEPASEA